jgi:prolyl oligopeptidase
MRQLPLVTPETSVEPITDVLHGVEVNDPYRWLEEQDSLRTRKWIEEQMLHARACLDSIPSRDEITKRITELLTVETYWMPQRVGNRYFFRKRTSEREQPCIYMRTINGGEDALLIDPSTFGADPYTSVSISQISSDGRLLLYEIKHGGERSGRFEILDIGRRRILPDSLPRGFLRGFQFATDGNGFYYAHEVIGAKRPYYRAAYYHAFGTRFEADEEVFVAGEAPHLRLIMIGDSKQLCFTSGIIGESSGGKCYLYDLSTHGPARLAFQDTNHIFGIALCEGKLFAMTDLNAPNLRIVEVPKRAANPSTWLEVVPEFSLRMKSFAISEKHFIVKYATNGNTSIRIFDLQGQVRHEVSFSENESTTVQLQHATPGEIFYKRESFNAPPTIVRYLPRKQAHEIFAEMKVPFDGTDIVSRRISYASKDGTQVFMYLVGRKDTSPTIVRPTILTGYGGFGVSMTPKFGILTSFMIEHGCLFALACLRGGHEFGEAWYLAARRRNRQKAFDDFISAAEWLLTNNYTTPEQLAIFGGSNSGLLVGAALTQRPELFRAVVCLAPLLDMLRYQHFDFARQYREEYGTAEDADDFVALNAYSPYHHVKDGVAYPAVLLISGDMDMNCNPMHARKMTARLQAASTSGHPVILDYNSERGHKPVMPLSERIRGLTNRVSFLCDELGISVLPDSSHVGTGERS